MKQEYFEIGQIVNHFGIKGMVKVNPFTDDISQFEKLKSILLVKDGKLSEVEIEETKYSKNQVLLKLKGIDTVEEAEKYRGCYLKIARSNSKKLPKDTYFIADLLGLTVYTDENILLGKVEDIYNSGANDIYVIKSEDGKQILLPGTKEVIKQIDLEQERITVHIIKGLI
ncbi:ribosome maturation factor RimM [Clostridium sp. CAG:567]|jgi:16S rRNA processing protein RimM|nr:ribosome maturation factor RimM [Clostridium sp. CAG:567]